MNRLLIAALAVVFMASASFAQGSNCMARKEALKQLREKYGEDQRVMGLVDDGAILMEIFVNRATGLWTHVITRANGITCFIGHGTDYVEIERTPNPHATAI